MGQKVSNVHDLQTSAMIFISLVSVQTMDSWWFDGKVNGPNQETLIGKVPHLACKCSSFSNCCSFLNLISDSLRFCSFS